MNSGSVPLKRVASIRVSNVDKKSSESQTVVKLCNYTDVYYCSEIALDQEFMQATATLDQIRDFGLWAGDTLITKDSETAQDIGISSYVRESSQDLVCGYHLALIRPEACVHPKFLNWFMQSDHAREYLSSTATGVTRFGLRADAIANLAVPRLDRRGQEAIADYLDTEVTRVDRMSATISRLSATWDERTRAQLNELLSAVHGNRIGLRYVTDSLSQGSSPQAGSRPAEPNERGILKLSAIKQGQFIPTENKVVAPEQLLAEEGVRAGDLLVSRANTPDLVGDSCAVPRDFPNLHLPDLIYRIRLSKQMDTAFVALCLQLPEYRNELSALARGTSQSMVKLRGEDILSIRIPIPPIEQQREISDAAASIYTRAKSAAAKIDRQIDLLRERRQALITAAVAGELDIPGATA